MRLMKDSGIEWIGLLPASWRLNRMGSMFYERSEKVSDIDFPPLSVTMKGVVPQLEHVVKSDDHFNRKLVRFGDFAINSRSDRRNSCGFSFTDGSVSLINTVLVPFVSMNSRYYEYLFKTAQFADEYYRLGHGIVNDLWTTKWIDAKRIELPLPSSEEQQIIADCLDKKCTEIDKAIEAAEASIEEYKLYKKSVIFQAVTKGLDPNVPMKDSGIEWVGSIPANWTTTRIKNLLAEKSVKGRPDETVLSLYREYGIIPKDSRDDNHNVTSSDTSSYKFIEVGDFVINKMKAWQGSMALSGYQGIISPAYLVYQFILEDVDPKYLHHLLRSRPYADEFARLSTGIRIGQWDLHSNDFLCTLALLPPLGEQTRIVAYVDDRCSEIDKAIEAKQLIIDELKAYKKSLIWEAVTGKREVV